MLRSEEDCQILQSFTAEVCGCTRNEPAILTDDDIPLLTVIRSPPPTPLMSMSMGMSMSMSMSLSMSMCLSSDDCQSMSMATRTPPPENPLFLQVMPVSTEDSGRKP